MSKFEIKLFLAIDKMKFLFPPKNEPMREKKPSWISNKIRLALVYDFTVKKRKNVIGNFLLYKICFIY